MSTSPIAVSPCVLSRHCHGHMSPVFSYCCAGLLYLRCSTQPWKPWCGGVRRGPTTARRPRICLACQVTSNRREELQAQCRHSEYCGCMCLSACFHLYQVLLCSIILKGKFPRVSTKHQVGFCFYKRFRRGTFFLKRVRCALRGMYSAVCGA